MVNSKQAKSTDKRIEEKLDALLRLTQDLFILQALKAGMGNDAVRKLLGVRMTRV
jgi:hypothetical protein